MRFLVLFVFIKIMFCLNIQSWPHFSNLTPTLQRFERRMVISTLVFSATGSAKLFFEGQIPLSNNFALHGFWRHKASWLKACRLRLDDFRSLEYRRRWSSWIRPSARSVLLPEPRELQGRGLELDRRGRRSDCARASKSAGVVVPLALTVRA